MDQEESQVSKQCVRTEKREERRRGYGNDNWQKGDGVFCCIFLFFKLTV